MLPPRQLLDAYGHRPTKALGQHFLTDVNALDGIVQAARLSPDDTVLEIGPGPGVLTCRLLGTGATIVAVEKDRRAVRFLREDLPDLLPKGSGRLITHEGDALRVDLIETLKQEAPGPFVAVGNLPYNAGTAIFLRLLDTAEHFSRGVLMFQREVAARLAASPGSKAYGSLSLAVQSRVHVELVLAVPPGSFEPPPKVHSAVIRFRTPDTPPVPEADRKAFDRTCRAAFSARRKTIRNALKGTLRHCRIEEIDAALDAAKIDPRDRAERVDLDRFLALARALP